MTNRNPSGSPPEKKSCNWRQSLKQKTMASFFGTKAQKAAPQFVDISVKGQKGRTYQCGFCN